MWRGRTYIESGVNMRLYIMTLGIVCLTNNFYDTFYTSFWPMGLMNVLAQFDSKGELKKQRFPV